MKLISLRLAKAFGWSTVFLFGVGLLFRFAIYGHMYIAPDAPYGISDIVEFFLGCSLMLALGLTVLSAIALAIKGPRENRIATVWLLVLCCTVALLEDPLHTLAAKWAI